MSENITRVWNTTLYLRLSKEDGDKEESNSIVGQRELLRGYLAGHPEFREYAVRVDDGWSGSSFERPSFQAMMEDVKAGRTDCIVVKDLSRFGRNYLDAGEYIEKVFPFLNVRFIAVNDNYDSGGKKNASDDLMVPFKNLMNEAYCRDSSIKIRSQLETKRKSGQFIGAFTTYGYRKDPEQKHRLILDDFAADIVRDMFRWKLEGVSPQDIANRLNKLGVLTPAAYKQEIGIAYKTPFQGGGGSEWSASNVLRILKNPIYTGVLIQGRETTPSYKVHKRITKPEDEWAVVENSHEAIVSKADFDTVQKVLSLDTRRAPGTDIVPLFSGLIFCGSCGSAMTRHTVPAGGKKYVYYVCADHLKTKSCSPHRMRDRDLEGIVLTALQNYIRQVIDLESLLELADTAPLRTAEAQKLQRRMDAKQAELARLNKLLMSLYENLEDGVITRAEFARFKQNYTAKAEEVQRQMETLRDAGDSIHEKAGNSCAWIAQIRKYENLTQLDRGAVVTLIDRIVIHPDKRIDITYRWQDEFAWQMDLLTKATAKEAV